MCYNLYAKWRRRLPRPRRVTNPCTFAKLDMKYMNQMKKSFVRQIDTKVAVDINKRCQLFGNHSIYN